MDSHCIVLIGGGGHALMVAETVRLAGLEFVGFLDDDARAALAPGARRFGGLADWGEAGAGGCGLILAVGDLALRRRLIGQAASADLAGRFVSVSHPTAAVSSSASIGAGVFIGPMAVVNPRADIADHAIINSGAVVEHECVIGENAHIAPGAVLGGGVSVGADALVGLGASVRPGVSIGAGAVVGVGAAVVRDVTPGMTVTGVPAMPLQRNPDAN